MAIIKFGRQPEKSSYNIEVLKERAASGTEKERIKKLEEARKTVIDEINQAENMAPPMIGPVGGVAAPTMQRQKQIETVLSSGLNEIYLNLTPEKQKQFKKAGEETAGKINLLLAKAKVNIGAIIKLIRKWLSLIPGVNRYFLEQEAKIKADEILKMKNENLKM